MSFTVEALARIAKAMGRTVLSQEKINEWSRLSDYQVTIFRYADADHFRFLWGLNDDVGGLAGIAGQLIAHASSVDLTVLILWDGTPEHPEDPGDIFSHVTPYEWALALSIILYGNPACERGEGPRLRIMILNATATFENQSFVQRNLFAFHNAVPWIQDYWPVHQSAELDAREAALHGLDVFSLAWLRQSMPQNRRNATLLLQDLSVPERMLTTFQPDDSGRPEHFGLLSEVWHQQFLKAGRRHSVANLIAPFALASGFPADVNGVKFRNNALGVIEGGSLARRALREVLGALELFAVDANGKGIPAAGLLSGDGGAFERRTSLKFLLVDDEFRLGFHHVFAYTLFGNRYVASKSQAGGSQWSFSPKSNVGGLTCESTVRSIFDALGVSSIDDWHQPRVLNVQNCDVLLLDLRFWLEHETTARRIFLDKLIETCGKLDAGKLNDDNPQFERAFRAAVACAQSGSTDLEGQALALLPLLMSYYDPSLPIVIFSSTQQRGFIELVRQRPNVVTEFSKPTLLAGRSAIDAGACIVDLINALEKARQLSESRIVWRRLVNLRVDRKSLSSIAPSVMNPQTPLNNLDDATIRRFLAGFFQKYLLEGRDYEFISIPAEFLERILVDTQSIASIRQGFLSHGLRWCRNKKAHELMLTGLVQRRARESIMRNLAIIEFLFLLDFLEGRDKGHSNARDTWRQMSQFLISVHPHLQRYQREGYLLAGELPNPENSQLSGAPKIDDSHFFCLALANAAFKSGRYLSSETERAFCRIVDEVAV